MHVDIKLVYSKSQIKMHQNIHKESCAMYYVYVASYVYSNLFSYNYFPIYS